MEIHVVFSPVPGSADVIGQCKYRGSDECAGFFEHQHFQDQRRTLDRFPPPPSIAALCIPVLPVRLGITYKSLQKLLEGQPELDRNTHLCYERIFGPPQITCLLHHSMSVDPNIFNLL